MDPSMLPATPINVGLSWAAGLVGVVLIFWPRRRG